jgi:pimeloyl-ACP methyl ester carboxylesterase
MYDFSSTRRDASTEYLLRPHVLLTACEGARVSIEYPSSMLLDLLTPSRPAGGGRPVLVIPGFYAGDGLTRRLRAHLRDLDYQVHGWRLGRNHGLTDEILDGVLARLDDLYERHGVPVSVVGWSFGGLLARWVAHERPAQVRQVVCLGSPWRPEGERTRTSSMFERAATKHGLSVRARQVVETLRKPLPVPCTAIFSKTDGILNWRGCVLDEGPGSENISVPSSHVGLVSNPLALAAIADRLAQDPLDPQPFNWARCLHRSLLGGSDEGASTTALVSL